MLASNTPDLSFPKSSRLRRRHDFVRMSHAGVKFAGRHFVVLVGDAGQDRTRLGITVSKRVGSAVVRNRLKRCVRECFRLNRELWPGTDVVVIARPSAAKLSCAEVRDELAKVLHRVPGR